MLRLVEHGKQRNTPTSMGKTDILWRTGWKRKKHPHKHGEDLSGSYLKSVPIETPPQAWGRRNGIFVVSQ